MKQGVTIGSLCTGIGGLDLASEAVYGGQMAWVSEIETSVLGVVEREWPGVKNLGDVKQIDWADVEPVDILTAGYPCQPFSHAGNRQGADDARHLWPYIMEAVRHLRPRRVVLENVQGHLSKGFDAVVQDLAEAGFDAEWCLLRASDVGAPHQRARVFIVATDAHGERHGGGQDGGAVGRVDSGDAGEARERERARQESEHRGGEAAADADSDDHRSGHEPSDGSQAPAHPHGAGLEGRRCEAPGCADQRAAGENSIAIAWGDYAPAVARWEHVLGRVAPAPTDAKGRLCPSFVEWMMGYPRGWVTGADVGMGRTQQLKALGNAVVPQQGLVAISLLEAALGEPMMVAKGTA